ncbi:MAG: biotin/lipoyl-binding protein, partial [Gammaproteobacteria bacterium]|nr:biotin/lipoyl-binding protein [Gammaproteobacteria bacterium]
MNAYRHGILTLIVLLSGCEPEGPLRLPGATEWDRNAVLAETSEPVVAWHVAEGDDVAAGQLLLSLDGARHDARIAQARAALAEARARLDELVAGPRAETIDRARAELASAGAAVLEAELAFDREAELLER